MTNLQAELHEALPDDHLDDLMTGQERDARSVAGGGPTNMDGAQDVLDVEEAAHGRSGAGNTITCWLFHAHHQPQEVQISDLSRLVLDDENFVWIDLWDFSEQELRDVAEALQLKRLAVHTALSQWQRPRLDVFDDQYFAAATIALLDPDETRVRAAQLDLFVGRNHLVSAHKVPLPLAGRMMARARQNPSLMRTDSAFLLYIILDELMEHYENVVEHLASQIEVMEEQALLSTSDDFLSGLLRFKRYIFAVTQLANQHRDVFQAFLRPDFPFVEDQEMTGYFRDLEGRLSRLLDDLASARDDVIGAFDIYVSQTAHRTNQVIKVLTIVSVTLLPATLIQGFFMTQFHGISVYNTWGLIAMIVSIATITSAILLTFRHRGWL